MPSKSKKQHNFMEAIAHSASFAKKVGVPQSVGKDFSKADKGKTFKRGGEMAATKMGKPVMKPGMSTAKLGMKAPTPMADTAMSGNTAGMGMMKKGGKVKKMAAGGLSSGHKSADGIASKGKTKGKQVKMAMGGMAKKYC
jgi:hypothetical protein